jgi:gliding motility-associated-like protein
VINNGGTYTLTLIAINGNGCNDTTSVIITVNDVAVSLVMPNVFTPNGDGVNDFFFPIMTSFKDMTCSIYDRWGVLIYEMKGVTDKWNGENTKGKEVPAGTYFYTFNGVDMNGKNYVRKGFVSLAR